MLSQFIERDWGMRIRDVDYLDARKSSRDMLAYLESARCHVFWLLGKNTRDSMEKKSSVEGNYKY